MSPRLLVRDSRQEDVFSTVPPLALPTVGSVEAQTTEGPRSECNVHQHRLHGEATTEADPTTTVTMEAEADATTAVTMEVRPAVRPHRHRHSAARELVILEEMLEEI